jgi:membrane protein YqaA with SNARE-associated domain
MQLFESLLYLFFDSFFASLILPPRSEMVVKIMVSLKLFSPFIIFIISYLASIVGLSANYFIGRYFNFLNKSNFFSANQKKIVAANHKWQKYFIWFLLFAWIDVIGATFSFLAGFFKTKYQKFLLLILSAKFLYYYLLIFADFDLKTML